MVFVVAAGSCATSSIFGGAVTMLGMLSITSLTILAPTSVPCISPRTLNTYFPILEINELCVYYLVKCRRISE